MVPNRLILSCLAFLLGLAAVADASEPLVKNGGFEAGLQGWSWQPGTARATAEVIPQAGLDGGTVVQIVKPAAANGSGASVLTQTVSRLAVGTSYRVVAWIKGKNSGRGSLQAGNQHVLLPTGTFDWTQVEVTFTAKAKGNVNVGIQVLTETEELWVSRVTLDPMGGGAEEISAKLAKCKTDLDELKKRLHDHSGYASDGELSLGFLIAEHYIERLKNGGPNGIQGIGGEHPGSPEVQLWNQLQVKETGLVLEQAKERLCALASGSARPYQMPKLAGGRISYDADGMLWKKADEAKEIPVLPGGYGFFRQIADDLDFLAPTGTTLVQQERGPRELSEEKKLTPGALSITPFLQRLADRGMFSDVLLSPHYFPEWALKKNPGLVTDAQGILKYNIDDPLAKSVIKDWINAFVPLICKSPALHSLCLSNEPSYNRSGRDPVSAATWARFLKARHGTIETLNERYGSAYPDFQNVPVPGAAFPTDTTQWPAYYDWVRFNQADFAAWHRWMYDLVKAKAPDIPVHAKLVPDIMDARTQAQRTHGGRLDSGVDPELIEEFSDLAGCDSWSFISQDSEYSHTWLRTQLWYDLLNSFHQRPVIDSELHLILDRYPAEPVPPEHIYNVLWQGALHHRAAYVLWLWEEPRSNSAKGSIYMRPADVYAAGKAALDLNRLAPEIRALNHQPADVALVYSMTSLFWEPRYPETVKNLYAALTFLGKKVTFVSEQQLEAGSVPSVPVLFLPALTHTTDGVAHAITALAQRGVSLLPVGDGNLAFNDYHQKRPLIPLPPSIEIGSGSKADMKTIGVALGGLTKEIPALNEVQTGNRAAGVDYRVADTPEGKLISLVSVYAHPQQLRIEGLDGGTDLISGRKVRLANFTLGARETLLIKVDH